MFSLIPIFISLFSRDAKLVTRLAMPLFASMADTRITISNVRDKS